MMEGKDRKVLRFSWEMNIFTQISIFGLSALQCVVINASNPINKSDTVGLI